MKERDSIYDMTMIPFHTIESVVLDRQGVTIFVNWFIFLKDSSDCRTNSYK